MFKFKFKDREDAAEKILPKLKTFKGNQNTVVLGLPRGGIVTASHLSEYLDLPLGFVVVKKIGFPGNPELAIGAVSEDGETVWEPDIEVDPEYKNAEEKVKFGEAKDRGKMYRGNGGLEDFTGKTIILADDGMATGLSMLSAVRTVKVRGATEIVVAVPVASVEAVKNIEKKARVVTVLTDPNLMSVGQYYDFFQQVGDQRVLEILKNAKNSFINK
jgi:putative phosphoribosyl transferase